MDPQTYSVLHILGLVLLMLGLGSILGAGREGGRPRRVGIVLHGLGLLVMLVAGFGLMSKTGIIEPSAWPLWLILKMAIWVCIAMVPTLVKKGLVPNALGWALVAALAATAAWLAITKPPLGS